MGTMTFGQQTFLEEAEQMVKFFWEQGYDHLDTAYVYNEGTSEKIVGQVCEKINGKIKIDTKVNPRITGRLDAEAVDMQFQESMQRMGYQEIDVLYLHFPDYHTPIESALEAADRWYKKGKFKRLGVSNFPAWLLVDMIYKCDKYGWVKPTVYEGLYNVLSRRAECELFDAIKEYDVSYRAYNPLAGGILTGKYLKYESKPENGRFTYRPNYQKRYWKKSYFDGMMLISEKCKKYDITIVEAAFRWLAFHSKLDEKRGDGIIIGASRVEQLKQNIDTVKKGKLPDDLVGVMEEAWQLCKADAPEYFRYYRN